MTAASQAQTTQWLIAASNGDAPAAASLTPAVYDQLKALAATYLQRERAGHTLQPTALVHEAFLRLINATSLKPADRTHFFAIAANVMRRVLVDHARIKGAAKRGGANRGDPAHRLTLSGIEAEPSSEVDIAQLDEALQKLARLDDRQARIVELRYFAGLTVEEVAEAIGVSKRTVESEWTLARAWLKRELAGEA